MRRYDTLWKKPLTRFKSDFPSDVLKLYKKKDAQKILDLGSGDGSCLCFLALQGFEVYGIELSKEGVKKTKEQNGMF